MKLSVLSKFPMKFIKISCIIPASTIQTFRKLTISVLPSGRSLCNSNFNFLSQGYENNQRSYVTNFSELCLFSCARKDINHCCCPISHKVNRTYICYSAFCKLHVLLDAFILQFRQAKIKLSQQFILIVQHVVETTIVNRSVNNWFNKFSK